MKSMYYFQMRSCTIAVAFLITLFGCVKKPETIFNIDERFEKIVSIPLEEIEEMPVFIFTDFGFYAFETNSSRISKYNNQGKFELGFGQKGSGPGEMELGIPISYSEEHDRLGIFDVTNFKVSYFDGTGNYLDSGDLEVFGKPHFQLSKSEITVSTFTQFPSNSTQKIYTDVITINNEKILEKETKLINNYELIDFYLYSINQDIVYILERSGKELDIYSYNPKNCELQKIEFDRSKIPAKSSISSFLSIDNYLILSNAERSKKPYNYFFDLDGIFLGTVNVEKELQTIAGVYDNKLYMYRLDKHDNQYLDIYSTK